MRKVKAVIFDMDGLLINSEKTWYQMYRRMLAPYGKSLSLEDYTQNYSGQVLKEIPPSLFEVVEYLEKC